MGQGAKIYGKFKIDSIEAYAWPLKGESDIKEVTPTRCSSFSAGLEGYADPQQISRKEPQMILRLFCPICAKAVADKKLESASVEVPSPMVRPSEDGCYDVKCGLGHESQVYVRNLKFELLFDMGIHALYDGYPREAVSCFASSLERFYEFFWRVEQARFEVPEDEVDRSWKALAKQSERQLGAYVAARLTLSQEAPNLPNPNTHVKLRNRVIHQGYIPTAEEAIDFGDFVLDLIRGEIELLRAAAGSALIATYDRFSPKPNSPEDDKDEDLVGVVNILTAIDVKHPPKGDDVRVGGVDRQLARVPRDRKLHGLELLSENAIQEDRTETE